MPRSIDLLRHGETTGGGGFRGSTDDDLTGFGWHQMEVAVAGQVWDRVITSPLARCRDFARAFAEQRALPLREDARLAEMHFGAWEGCTASELLSRDAEALGRFWRDPVHEGLPGAEPLLTFQARVLAAWDDILRADEPRILVITHGGPIRVILSHLAQRPLERILELDVGHGSRHSIRGDARRVLQLAGRPG